MILYQDENINQGFSLRILNLQFNSYQHEFFITWKSFWMSGTLFPPMYSATTPASDTTLVGVAKIILGVSAGTLGLSPCEPTTAWSKMHVYIK